MSVRKPADHWNDLAHLAPDASVIDPADFRGLKNRYLAQTRDLAFADGLARHLVKKGVILDFGCGTGSAVASVLREGHRVIGLDISERLLRQARERCDPDRCLFVMTDGAQVPLSAASMDAAIIYVVLSYIIDDTTATALLREIRRALSPNAPLVMIEQTRRTRAVTDGGQKVQRTAAQWASMLEVAGFKIHRTKVLRQGRFPTTPMIKAGLLPVPLWSMARRLDALTGDVMGPFPWDYAEVLFEATA